MTFIANPPVRSNWQSLFNVSTYDSIDNDFILFELPNINQIFYEPFKPDLSIALICISGSMKVRVNLREYELKAPCLLIIVSRHILEYLHISPDFNAYYVLMSDRFNDSLFSDLRERYPLKHSVLETPLIPLNEKELQSMVNHYRLMRDTVRMKENPYRIEIIQLLIKAFFYQTTYQHHKTQKDLKKSKFDILFDKFLEMVQQHFKQKRDVEFYGAQLCLTPKYLSKILKEKTDKTASEWIIEHVILESKALLQSTNLTIQQISNGLNFPSQSFFGKYFKQYVGISPKDYRMNSRNK